VQKAYQAAVKVADKVAANAAKAAVEAAKKTDKVVLSPPPGTSRSILWYQGLGKSQPPGSIGTTPLWVEENDGQTSKYLAFLDDTFLSPASPPSEARDLPTRLYRVRAPQGTVNPPSPSSTRPSLAPGS
jgi:hypothetical protein